MAKNTRFRLSSFWSLGRLRKLIPMPINAGLIGRRRRPATPPNQSPNARPSRLPPIFDFGSPLSVTASSLSTSTSDVIFSSINHSMAILFFPAEEKNKELTIGDMTRKSKVRR
uniref:Uncharacterized protein n=1 Tax=Plectus sambesii TaxID=2011161 RepID=A0A914XIA9_9BILA